MSSKDKENLRRCSKCGCSPAMDPNIAIFRFPKPGKTNTLRCELWAQYCFPDGEWFSPKFQLQLHNQHKVLCSKHFNRTSFSDYPTSFKKLHRFAVPENKSMVEPQLMSAEEPAAGPSTAVRGVLNLTLPQPHTSEVDLQLMSAEEPVAGPSAAVRGVSNKSTPQPHTYEVDLQLMSAEPAAGPSTAVREVSIMTVPQPHTSEVHSASSSPGPALSTTITADNIQETSGITPGTKKPSARYSKDKKEMSPREKKLFIKCKKNVKKIWELKKRIKKMKNRHILEQLNQDESVNELVQKLTPTFALMLQSQIRNFKKKAKGWRWTTDEKIVALRLFKRSPTCYRLMRRLFHLPAQSTLKSLLSQFNLEVGVNKIIFDVLKEAAKKDKPSDNEYILTFDEMSIKKHLHYNRKQDLIEGYQDHSQQGRCNLIASHALVFLLSGIRKKKKQPVAFYLSSGYVTADRLAVLIKEILLECLNAGLNIAATVCDMDGVNRRALAILGATVEKPTIKINDVEVVTIFDPPHLLKCFRNMFLKYNIECMTDIHSENKTGVGLAKWSHIEEFYEIDCNNKIFVYAPALKREHLDPNTKEKMRVKLAAQVLSHTVAAGMMAKIAEGSLSTEAITTVNVIENMDKLFDTLNSDSTDLRRGKIFSTNLKNNTPHLEFMKKMKLFFLNLKFVGCTRSPPSKEGWVWTLNAVEQIWSNLVKKHKDIKSLATRRLQQDPLENLFGCIRGNCGSNVNPTAGQFVAALKTAILTNLAHQGIGNCESDDCSAIINNYKTILNSKATTNIHTETTNASPAEEEDLDQELPEDVLSGKINACAYVCGFLYKKIGNSCTNCQSILLSSEESDIHLFISFKEYNENKKSLNYCSKEMILYVESCATKINKILEEQGHKKNIYKEIFSKLIIVESSFLKNCPDHWELVRNNILKNTIYVCIKRFIILKNRTFGEESSRKALKRKIEILTHI